MTHVLGTTKPVESKGETPVACPVCGDPLDTGPVVVCKKCKTPHHRQCWRYGRHCSVYGCGCRTFKAAPPSLHGAVESFTARQSAGSGRTVLFLVGLVGALAAGRLFADLVLGSVPAWISFVHAWTAAAFAVLALVVLLKGYYLITFLPHEARVDRQLFLFESPLLRPWRAWLQADQIVEVHLHRYGDGKGGPVEYVAVALEDGTRRSIQAVLTDAKEAVEDLERLSERIAVFADTSVRLIETDEVPTFEEILLAAREREAEPERRLAVLSGGEDQGDDEAD